MDNKLKFCLFADFHYRKGMYSVTLSDLLEILNRAEIEQAEAIFHAGDFCNDYNESAEIIAPLLNNKMGLPVCGVYGNHEIEGANCSMQVVTPYLTNVKMPYGAQKTAKLATEVLLITMLILKISVLFALTPTIPLIKRAIGSITEHVVSGPLPKTFLATVWEQRNLIGLKKCL